MEALALDPGPYTGSYKLIAGRVALDFVNTVSWPGTDREHDWLSSAENVATWAGAVGLAIGRIGASDLSSIHGLRSEVGAALRPLSHAEQPDPQTIETFNGRLRAMLRLRRIDALDLTWTWVGQTSAVDWFAPVILDAAELITGDRRARLKHCPSCHWLFEDQTRNGKRRWCDMADCGSRAKSRDYYQRTRNH